MARASTIWLAVIPDYNGDHVEAAFTVKHECASWCRRNPSPDRVRYVRKMPDGGREGPVTSVTEGEFLAANA